MYKGNKEQTLLNRCIALLLALVMSVSLVNAEVIVGHADDEEPALHQHTFACYDDYWEACGLGDDPSHTHTYDCYETYGYPVCGFEDGDVDGHRHNHDGFICDIVAQVASCGMAEHQHSEECYANPSDAAGVPDEVTPAVGADGLVDFGDLQKLLEESLEYLIRTQPAQTQSDLDLIDESVLPNAGMVWDDEHGHYHESTHDNTGETLFMVSPSTEESIDTSKLPQCGLSEHVHTDDCITDVYSCRWDESGIMLLGASNSDYTASMVWNINDSTMIPRDSTKQFVTWKNDQSTTISAIATASFQSNVSIASGSMTITLPCYLYTGRNGAKEGKLDTDALRAVLRQTGLGITSQTSERVVISNTTTITPSTSITFGISYKIDVLNTYDKQEFNSLRAEFKVNSDMRAYTLGGQIDSGIRSISGTPLPDSVYPMRSNGRHYYFSSTLSSLYGLTQSEFDSWESRGYILVEHGFDIQNIVKNQPAVFSMAIAPSNQGRLVKMAYAYGNMKVTESYEGTGYVYRISSGGECNNTHVRFLVAYPKSSSVSTSDPNQASVSCASTLTLTGVDGEDVKSTTVRNYHSSMLNKATYSGSKFAIGHSFPQQNFDGALQLLASGKNVKATHTGMHFVDYRKEFNASNPVYHTVDTFNDKVYLTTTNRQVYELGAGDIAYKTIHIYYNGDGEPLMVPVAGTSLGFVLQGVVDNPAGHRSDGGAYEVYVLTPESPNKWVYDGKIDYDVDLGETYEIKHENAFAWKVSFNKAMYFSTAAFSTTFEVLGSSRNVQNIAKNAIRSGATSLELGSWYGVGAHPNTSSTTQECTVQGASISGDTVPMVHNWDARFWNQYGYNTSADKYPFRYFAKESLLTVSVESTMRQSAGFKSESGKVSYGEEAKGVAAKTLTVDLDSGFVLSGNFTQENGTNLLEAFKGGNTAFDSVTVNYYTLLPKGFELKDTASTSPHRVMDSAPDGFGPLSALKTGYMYANTGDSSSNKSEGVVTTTVTRNYKGTGQQMVKTSVRYPVSLLSNFACTYNGSYRNNWGSVFPLTLNADYIIGTAPVGTYYVYTAVEFLDAQGYPYDLSDLTRSNVFVDNGSVFSGTSVQSIFSGVGSAKRPGQGTAPTIMGVRSSVTTSTSSTVTGGYILASTDTNPGWDSSTKAELGDEYRYRWVFSDQEGTSDGVVMMAALDGGTSDHTSEYQGVMTGIDLSYCEDLGMNPKVFVNKDYIDKSKYLSSTSKPSGVTASDLISGFDGWALIDYKTFSQWNEVKSVAVYFDKAGSSNGYVFNATAGFAVVEISMKQPSSGLRPGRVSTAYTELLIHANHRSANDNSTTLANYASVAVDATYRVSANEYVAGPGWTSEWPGLYTNVTTYPGDDYAYRVDFRVDQGKITDIVLYDSIETELDTDWQGTLLGLARVTSGGMKFPFDEGAKLYVNENVINKQEYMEASYGPAHLNDASNGWKLVQNPATFDGWDNVRSIAISLGSSIYSRGDALSFVLRMKAPTKGLATDRALYATDTSFVTLQLLNATERGSVETRKVSTKIDLRDVAGVSKQAQGEHYTTDATPEKGASATAGEYEVNPGLTYTYTLYGSSAAENVLGDWVIVDDLKAGTFANSIFVSAKSYWSPLEGEDAPATTGRIWIYVGEKNPGEAGFWGGVNKASLGKGLADWFELKEGQTVSADYAGKVKAIAATHDGALYNEDGNFEVAVTMRAPKSGFASDKTYAANNQAQVIFSTKKGEEDYTSKSNTTKVTLSTNGDMAIDQTITPSNLDGTWGEASGYSAPVYPTKEYLYSTTASFEGTMYEPVLYSTVEKDQSRQGTINSYEVLGSNLRDYTTGELVTPTIYLSKNIGDKAFEGATPNRLQLGSVSGWVKLEDIPAEEIGEYRSWIAVGHNAVACSDSQLIVRIIVEAPKYDAYGAISNTSKGYCTVLGTSEQKQVDGRVVYAIPSEVRAEVTKAICTEKDMSTPGSGIGGSGGDDSEVEPASYADASAGTTGLDPFYYGIEVKPVFDTAHRYGFLKDILVEDRFRDLPNSDELIVETMTELDTTSIPEGVSITAFVNEDTYGTENVLPADGVMDVSAFLAQLREKGFKAVTRDQFAEYDWSNVKHLILYFGTEESPYEWEVSESTQPWDIFIGMSRDYGEFVDDGNLDPNIAEEVHNRVILSAHGAQVTTDESTTSYSANLPHPVTNKEVRHAVRSESVSSEFLDVGRGYYYEYTLSFESNGSVGATDYVLFESLEGMNDSQVHGTLDLILLDGIQNRDIPVSVFGSTTRYSEEELASFTVDDLRSDEWTYITSYSEVEFIRNVEPLKTLAFYLGTKDFESWVDDGVSIQPGMFNIILGMRANDMFKDSDEEGVIGEVYIARNRVWTSYTCGGIKGNVPGTIAGVNYTHTAEDQLESDFFKTVTSTFGTSEDNSSATTPLGGTYTYDLDYEVTQGASNVAIGDTIEGTQDESGWHGTLTGIDISSITEAGFTPEVWVSNEAIEDWGEVFGDSVNIPAVDPTNYGLTHLNFYGDNYNSAIVSPIDAVDKYYAHEDGQICSYGFNVCKDVKAYIAYWITVKGNPGDEYAFTALPGTTLYHCDDYTCSGADLVTTNGGLVRGVIGSGFEDSNGWARYIAFTPYTGDISKVGAKMFTTWIEVNGSKKTYTANFLVNDHVYENGVCKYCGDKQPVQSLVFYEAYTSTSAAACPTSTQQDLVASMYATFTGTPNTQYTLSIPAGSQITSIAGSTVPVTLTTDAKGDIEVRIDVKLALRESGTVDTTKTITLPWNNELLVSYAGITSERVSAASDADLPVLVRYRAHNNAAFGTNTHKCSYCGDTTACSFAKYNSTNHRCTECLRLVSHTYTSTGSTATQHKCTVCSYATSHTYASTGSTTTQHKCSVCSYAANHSFTDYSSTQHRCSVCSLSVNHTWSGVSETGGHKCTGCNTTQTHTWSSSGGYHTCKTCNWKSYCKYWSSTFATDTSSLTQYALTPATMLDYIQHTNYNRSKRLDVCGVCKSMCAHNWTYTLGGTTLPFQVCSRCGLPGTDLGTTYSAQGVVNQSGASRFDVAINTGYVKTGTYPSIVSPGPRVNLSTGMHTSTRSTSIRTVSETLSLTNSSSNKYCPLFFDLQQTYSFTAGDMYSLGVMYGGTYVYFMDYLYLGKDDLGYYQFRMLPVVYATNWGYGQFGVNLNATRSASLMSLTDDELPQATFFEERSTSVIDAWAGHDISKFEQVPNDQLSSYDWSQVKSIAIRLTRNSEYWDTTDYFPLNANKEGATHIKVRLHMKAPIDAKGTTGDLAYNRAVFWELDGQSFESKATATPLTTVRLLGWNAMPNTGGSGATHYYYVGGLGMVLLGAWLTFKKKKRAICRASRR